MTNNLVYGSDFSDHQAPQPDMTGWRFAYIKATEGTTYVNKYLVQQSTHVEKTVKQRGYYHYFHPGHAKEQADFFVNTIGIKECQDPYVELWLDFEEKGSSVTDAKIFMDRVKQLTGKECGLYASQSWLCDTSFNWKILSPNTPLWVAMYPNNNRFGNNLTEAEFKWSINEFAKIPHFKLVHVWQYGAGAGYDWNFRYTPFPTAHIPSIKKPKYKEVIKVKADSRLYKDNGRDLLMPNEKSHDIMVKKNTRVTFIGEVGNCYKVEYFQLGSRGNYLYLHRGNF